MRSWSPRTPPGSEDRSKHLWHVLTLEHWYRDAAPGVTVSAKGQTATKQRTLKQVVQNYKSGELALLDVPVPACKPGGVLVAHRCTR